MLRGVDQNGRYELQVQLDSLVAPIHHGTVSLGVIDAPRDTLIAGHVLPEVMNVVDQLTIHHLHVRIVLRVRLVDRGNDVARVDVSLHVLDLFDDVVNRVNARRLNDDASRGLDHNIEEREVSAFDVLDRVVNDLAHVTEKIAGLGGTRHHHDVVALARVVDVDLGELGGHRWLLVRWSLAG